MINIEIYDGGYSDEQRALDQAEYAKQTEAIKSKLIARQAVLDKLGLTENEAQLLLGGR
jgi:hypothetical protein